MKRFLLAFSIITFVFSKAEAQSNQTVTNGTATTAVNFPGTGCVYNWVNDTPGIGLPASGTGNIASFTAVNTGSSPVTATITATPTGPGFAYIVNSGSNNVSVISTATSAVLATIPVGLNPNSICVDPNYNEVYVVNNSSNTVSVINTVTNTVKATIPVGPSPWAVTVSPDGSLAYVADGGDNAVQVINSTTNTVISTIPAGSNPNALAVSPDGSLLYVNNSNSVLVINANTNMLVATIPVGSAPQAILITPDGSKVYEANYGSNNVNVISTATNTVIATIPVGVQPGGGSMSPDGSTVYVANEGSNSISVISTATNTVTATIPVGINPWGVSVSPDGSQLYVANSGSNTISVVNTTTDAILSTISVGSAPYSFGSFFSGGMGCSAPVKFTITVNPTNVPPPTITASAATGTISACAGTTSSSPNIQQFTVSGSNLTDNITATAPPGGGFEISVTAGSGYGNSVTIAQSGGSVGSAVVYVRSAASASPGSISGNVALTSTGATSQNVAVTGTVNALPMVNTVANQTLINGTATTAINFTGTANTFTWINDTPGIGLAANGTGNIPSFTAVNTGSSPVTATITATPLNTEFAYIGNATDGTVSVIILQMNTVVATIPVGSYPNGVTESLDGTRVYVANYNSNTVSVINTSTNIVIATIPVGSVPTGISVSPDGTRVYVANQLDNDVGVINTANNTVITNIGVGVYPAGLSVSPDGSKLYVTDFENSNISVINTTTNTVISYITVGHGPLGIKVSPDGSHVYATNLRDGTISVIDVASNLMTATIAVGSGPTGITVSPDGSRVYVGNINDGTVSVINTSTNTVIATISVGSAPEGVIMSPDGSRVYVATQGLNTVTIINTATNSVVGSVAVGQGPLSFGDNISVGCSGAPIKFTITVNPSLPAITTTGALSALSTTYGTASSSASFNVSGANMTAGISVTPPAGFEVSTDNVNFSSTITISGSGTIVSTPVYIRLASTTPVGTYTGNIVLSSTSAANVNVIMPASTVTPAPLSITANNQSSTYGSAIPPLTASYSGFVNGDTQASLTTQPTVTTTATAASPVGTYPIAASGAVDGNYTITYVAGTLTISTATLTITASNQSSIYGSAIPPLTASYSGFVNGDTQADLTTPPTITTTATTSSPVGTYPITASGAVDGNYTITYIAGVLTITTATLTVTANDQSKVYGTENPALTVSYSGFVNGDTRAILTTPPTVTSTATSASLVGIYPITACCAVANDDYNITYVSGTLTITPALLTITANDTSKAFGQVNPVFTVTYSGFVNNDGPDILTAKPMVTTTAVTMSPVGQYPIIASGAESPDYTFVYVPGVLTIIPLPPNIVIPNTFTPNGDGINDTWDIKYLDAYPNCTVNIFNRYGGKVFSSIGYGVPWDGRYGGANLPQGTYYYIINLQNGANALSGFVVILR